METDTQKKPLNFKLLAWVLVIGGLAPMLDTTIVNVAIPTLGHDLHTTVALSQWTITGYLLAMGIIIPISGWLKERLGGKKLWLLALAFFLIGSVLAGASWNIDSMIVFRVIQGIGAGIITPLVVTLLLEAAHGQPLGKLMATVGLPIAVVPIFGPVVAGIILNNFDWRWIFYVNVPIVIIGFMLACWKLPKYEPLPNKRVFDWLGFLQLAPAITLILYGLSQATGKDGFSSENVWLPIIVGGVLTTCFVAYSFRKKDPLINLHAFRARSYAMSAIILFLSGLSVYGPLLLISLFYQEVQHQTVLVTGLLLAPQGIGSLISRVAAGKLTDKIGSKPIILAGLALATLGTLPFAFATANTSEWFLAAALFVRGLGLTPIIIAVMVGAFQGLPKEETANASSTVRIIQQVGGSFGTAVLVLILTQATLTLSLPSEAFNLAFLWSIGFVILALVPALLLPKFVKK
jgi:EmrB/QacA subfamily drug resistance transporter